jgi:hypothetical protein
MDAVDSGGFWMSLNWTLFSGGETAKHCTPGFLLVLHDAVDANLTVIISRNITAGIMPGPTRIHIQSCISRLVTFDSYHETLRRVNQRVY